MILVVSQKKSQSREIAEIINYSGVLAYAATAKEAYSQASPFYRAILVYEPSFLFDVKGFIDTIHSYVKNIPIYALYAEKVGEEGVYFEDCFTDNIFSSSMIYRMEEIAVKKDLPRVGDYRLAGINASVNLKNVLYFDKPVNLTKTEKKILKFLIRSYPLPRKSETIIKYLYKPSKSPEQASVRTHICKINSKFEKISGQNLIQSPGGEGYVIYTPELKEKYEEI